MSAIRRNSSRSEARKKRSTPYARGLFGTFARFFGFLDPTPTEDLIESDGDATDTRNVVQSPQSPNAPSKHAPLTPSKTGNGVPPALRDSSLLPVPNSEQVASYFSHRMGANVTANEVESMVTNLQTTPERERFRFTFTTPGRDSPPSPDVVTSPLPRTTPSRKLSRNPNGVYRWEGAGSAKAARQCNRFGSPAFGASPTKPGSELGKPESTNQDNKRRKIGEGVSTAAQSSGPTNLTSSVLFPHTLSNTRTNGITRQTSPLPPSRLRSPAKPTAPINPSPLRQTWSDVSSTSSREDNKSSQPVKQTKTANFVAELIKETAPPKKPDLSNPYQTASPVGKVGPPRRANKRPRAVGRPVPPTKEQKAEEEKRRAEEQKRKEEELKLKALSAQAIIEATVPKGSKRSRPPANFEKQSSGNVARSPSPPQRGSVSIEKVSYVVEEIDDEDLKRTVKKSKPAIEGYGLPSSLAKPVQSDVTIEEIDEVEMQTADKRKDKEPVTEPSKSAMPAGSVSRPTPFTNFSSIPREPSKLRFSFQADSSPSSTASTPVSPQAPVSLPTLPTALEPSSPPTLVTGPDSAPLSTQGGFNFTFKPSTAVSAEESGVKATEEAAVQTPDVASIKARVRSMDIKSLPTFVFASMGSSTSPSTGKHVNAQEGAKAVPVSSLPTFDFGSTNSFTVGFDSANPKPISAPNTSSLPNKASSPAFNPFSGNMPSSIPTTNIFGTIPSKSSAVPAPSISAIVKPFDFAGAGMKQPTTTAGTWNCGLCGLSNPQTTSKCTICDAIKPGSSNSQTHAASLSSPSAPPVQAFDWAAAGMKAPTVSSNTWTCSRCASSSPTTTDKCTICDEPRFPAGSSSSASSVSTPPKSFTSPFNASAAPAATPTGAPPVKPFDFAAAGLKPPTFDKGTWVCSLCGLQNPEAALTCTTCENPK